MFADASSVPYIAIMEFSVCHNPACISCSRNRSIFFHAFRVLHPLFFCYARIVSDRLRVLRESVIMDEQGGFRAGRGCVVFAVRHVI